MQSWVPIALVANAMLAAALAYEAPDFALRGWARFGVFVAVAGSSALLAFFGRAPGTAKVAEGSPALKVVS